MNKCLLLFIPLILQIGKTFSQTIFKAGDLVPVAYRMNATGAQDEIALVTFVNIAAGTEITFTDGKYTTNATPQCSGGLVWTAPAGGVTSGTIIKLQTDAKVVSVGSVTGASFGLSSSGDQVIVYTGSYTNPTYITALTSNNWLSSNTSCNGSNSMIPSGLADGTSSLNMNTATGNVSGLTVNAYYNGIQEGTTQQLKAAILNPANWISSASGTAAQTWPAYNFPGPQITKISFKDKFVSVNEGAGTATINLVIENPADATAKVVLKASPFSNTNNTDLTFSTQTVTINPASSSAQSIVIPITDDTESEMDEYFVLSIEDLNGITLSGKQYLTVYIKDNDRTAPVGTQDIKLNFVSSFKPNTATGSTTEIVAYDAVTKRLFMISAGQDRLDIADFSNPSAISLIKAVDMKPYGGVTSVAVKNGIVAVASPANPEHENGSVVLLTTDGTFQKQVTVGALPDMVTFSPDGSKILTANEGQPNADYSIDPEGSVSIIDISAGVALVDQSKVMTLLFTDFNSQEAALATIGVRKTKASSTLSQDLEPEYITFSSDSKKAWVALQENNSIAEINLETKTITSIWGLGQKDFSVAGTGFDASDNSGKIHISNYPVKSFYMPDGVSSYSANGKTYLVTANEGDEKEYGTFVERTTVSAVTLDPTIFPNASVLKEDNNIGRLRITNLNGDTDKDGDYDELIMVGARSFSIWDASAKTQVYDSKDDFELITSQHPTFSAQFNADSESNGAKNRSRSKGPEPEGVTIATIEGKTYAFIGLERIGGVMVYNITDPNNVKFVDYKNNRSTTSYTGDFGPEGICYIASNQSADSKPYIIVANEISGTISVFEIEGSTLPVEMLSFDARLKNNGEVTLKWATASENNNDYFSIEKSTDGKKFSLLHKINSNGDKNSIQSYSVTDKYPSSGINYYRLTQTDKDGTISKPWITSANLDLLATQQSLNIYPNPVIGNIIKVKTGDLTLTTTAQVKFLDLGGKLVYSNTCSVNAGEIEIRMQQKLTAGTYVISIAGIGSQKIVVQD